MGEDEKFRRQEGKRLIDSAGGIKEFEERHTQQVLLDQQNQLFAEKMESNELTQQSLTNQINVQNKALEKATQKDEILNHYYRLNSEGQPTMNMDGFEKMGEYGATFSEVAKSHRIKGFSPMNFAEYLQKKSGIDYTDKRAVFNMVDEFAGVSNASGEDHKRYREIAEAKYVDPKEIQERAESKIFLDPTTKKAFEQVGNFGELSASWKNAIGINSETGERFVKSNVSANMLQRAMAKIGNGGGNMTDGDVNAISGATDWNTTWKRVWGKLMEADGEGEVASMLSAEDVDMIGQAGEAIYQHNLAKRSKAIKAGLKETKSSYPQLNMQTVFKHSGFGQFLEFDHMGNTTPTTEQIQTDNVDFLGGMQVADTDTLHAINRMVKEKGSTFAFDEFLKANPDITEDQMKNRFALAQKWEKGEVESPEEMMVGGGAPNNEGSSNDGTGASESNVDFQSALEKLEAKNTNLEASEGIGATGVGAGVTGTLTANRAQNHSQFLKNRMNYFSKMNKAGLQMTKNQISQIATGNSTELRQAGNALGMKPNELRNVNASPQQREVIRAKIKKKFDKKLTEKIIKTSAKLTLTGTLKRYLLSGIAGILSGGTMAMGVNFALTASDLADAEGEATLNIIKEMQASAETPEEFQILDMAKAKYFDKNMRDDGGFFGKEQMDKRFHFGR